MYIYRCIYTHIYIYIPKYICMFIDIDIWIHKYIYTLCVCAKINRYVYINIYTYRHTNIYRCRYMVT